MAVVIMRMVDAHHAGVLFTADPQGRPTDLRIELVEGLADELVTGRATPRAIVVPRRGARSVPGDMRGLVNRLVRLGVAVEDRFGAPQDIEWASTGDEVFLVQSRPITTSLAADDDGFDTPLDPRGDYTTAGVAEMLPPLLWSLNGPMVDDAFRRLFDSLGVRSSPDEPVVVRVRGRAAMNLDALRSAATAAGGSARELELQYFGEVLTHDGEDVGRPGGRLRVLAASLRAARLRRALAREARTVRAAVDGIVDSGLDGVSTTRSSAGCNRR